ncbi:hypothetical protein ACTXG6_05990 [Pseudonocardia sp. Cha107L01]|uniref:hypothetical protein n=1 Tax=Pseudonocardia sp. Cha107L01 TaxID=3457576 RepID=UPI00403E7C4B
MFHLMSNSELNDLIGQRVRDARKRRDWSVEEVIAKCADQGLPLTTGQMYLIETRGKEGKPRRRITVDELLTLAHVLGVSPLALLLPENDTEYPVTGGTTTRARMVYEWMVGERLPPLPGPDAKDAQTDEERAAAWLQFTRAINYIPKPEDHWLVGPELERITRDGRDQLENWFSNSGSTVLNQLESAAKELKAARDDAASAITSAREEAYKRAYEEANRNLESVVRMAVTAALKHVAEQTEGNGEDGESTDQAD